MSAHKRHVVPVPSPTGTRRSPWRVTGIPKVDYGVPADTGVKFPELEQKVLKQWDDDDTFRASVSNRDG